MPRLTWPSSLSVDGKSALALFLGALGYFALARLGLSLASLQESASPVWPASGFALALLIVHGWRCWPAIALGAFCANALTGGIVTALPITLGNTLEALLGFVLYQRLIAINPAQLPIARSAALAAAAALAPLVSAGIGVAALATRGALGTAEPDDVMLTWWAGDALGILLLTPLLLAWHQSHGPLTKPALLQLAGLVAAIAATSALAFLEPGWGAAIFFSLPIVLLAARWLGWLGTSLCVLLTALAWLAGTLAGLGPFAGPVLNVSLINMQIMLAALGLAGLALAEVVRPRLTAADLVYLAGGLIAALIFLAVTQTHVAVDQRHFNNLVARISSQITERMGLYASTLQGGASLYAASRDVHRTEWHNYVHSLDIFARHPGIYAIGVIVPADPASRATFVSEARKDGMPDFDIHPIPGVAPVDAAYPQQFVIIYAEPDAENLPAIGLDIASEPGRRNAALAARDSGLPAITPHITLVQTNSPGFLLLVPMYREPLETLNAASLRWSFHGWVYAAFAADRFFSPSLPAEGSELRLQVLDGVQPTEADFLFDSGAGSGATRQSFMLEKETQLLLYGRTFTLRWQRAPDFQAQSPQIPILFSAGLILFATLLAALIATLMSQKDRALAVARQMNAALTASTERFSLAVACSRDGVWDYDVASGTVWSSPRYKEIYGYEDADVTDHWAFWRSIILPADMPQAQSQYDEMMAGTRAGIDIVVRYRHKLGHVVHVHSRALPVRDDTGAVTRVVGVHTDITLVVDLEQQLKDAIGVMVDGFGLFDADDRLILFNEGFIDAGTRLAIGDPTGCTFEEVVRAFVEHDMPDARDPAFDRETWIRQRMERHRNPPQDPIEVKWGGDRWMRISERRTANGGYVGVWTDITEIRKLGQRLSDAINALSDGFALFDADDRLAIFNQGFMSDSLRQAFGDPTGRTFEEIYRVFAAQDTIMTRGADREKWLQERLLLHRHPPLQPYEFEGSDGRWTRILERRTSDGGWVGTWTDVTEERMAQRRLQDAISSMPDGFALFDADDKLVICNEAYMHSPALRDLGNLVGIPMAEILHAFAHADITDIRARQDPAGWIAYRMDRHLNPPPDPYEQIMTDGRVLHISERRTSDGGIVGIWSDVTALRQAERRLQDAIASINEGFVLLDADGRYVVFNDEFLRLYPKMAPYVAVGASFEQTMRQGALAGEYPHLTTPAEIEAFVTEWVARYRNPAAYQGEGLFADGRWVLIGHRGTADGGCVNVYTDITMLKQRENDLGGAKARLEKQAEELMALADNLKSARRAAEDANRSKSGFLADMSHELRTPLNAILGFSDIIRGEMFGKIEPPRYAEYAADIHRSGAHLLQLINDLLDISKIEANKLTLNVEAISMTELVDHATRLVAGLAQERGVTVSAPPDDICPIVHADERQMRQILLNLLSNAVKFTAAGGHVTVRADMDGESGIVITVTDTGIGMTGPELKMALERFGQVENSLVKSVPGTGLGLPLVAAIAKLHGGRLDIASEKGKGTTVTVRLPWHGGLTRPL